MTELSRAAREIVRAGRAATRPSREDRDRVTRALLERVGDSAFAHGLFYGGFWSRGLVWKGFMTVAVVFGLGAAGYGALRPTPANQPSLPIAAPVAHPAGAAESRHPSLPSIVPEAPPAVAQPPRPVTHARAAVSAAPRPESRARDRLAEEVVILSRAEAELHRGQADSALRALGEHQRKFPRGTLSPERRAVRVRALCALGRTGEAQAELARLSRAAPGSVLAERARDACGTRATSADDER